MKKNKQTTQTWPFLNGIECDDSCGSKKKQKTTKQKIGNTIKYSWKSVGGMLASETDKIKINASPLSAMVLKSTVTFLRNALDAIKKCFFLDSTFFCQMKNFFFSLALFTFALSTLCFAFLLNAALCLVKVNENVAGGKAFESQKIPRPRLYCVWVG